MGQKLRVGGVAVAVGVAALLGPLGVAPAALADAPPQLCAAEFVPLTEATEGVQYLSRRNAVKDEAGLLGKIEAAKEKLMAEKTDDSDGKLADYQAKVVQLRAAGKIVEIADGESVDLLALAQDARECVKPVG